MRARNLQKCGLRRRQHGADLTSRRSNRAKMRYSVIYVIEIVAASRSVNHFLSRGPAAAPRLFEGTVLYCLRYSAARLQSTARGGGDLGNDAECGLVAMARSLQMTQIDTILE